MTAGFVSDDLRARVDALPPQKRALFERLLAERSRPGVHELSVTQQGLWFLDRVLPRSPLYTIAWRCELRGPLDAGAFERAVNATVARHETLRTRFGLIDGRPAQLVAPELVLRVPVEDLSATPGQQRETLLDGRIEELTADGFDLSHGPLLRVTVFRLAAERHVVLLLANHIVFDYVSTDIFLAEVVRGYDALVTGREPDLPALPMQYGDFARWQRRHLSGDRLAALTRYWTDRLAGADGVPDLPTDRPRPAVQSFRGAGHVFAVPAEVMEPLRALAQRERVTLFMVYLATFQTLLHRYSAAAAVSVGVAVDARTRPELRPLIGFFINSVVVRTDVSGNPSFRDLLDRVRRACLEAYEHQDLPFDQVVEAVAPARSLSHNPLFQVTCALDEPVSLGLAGGGVEVIALDAVHTGQAKFDLSFGGTLHGGAAQVRVDFNRDLFDEATVARMGRHFVALLATVGRDARQPIDRLRLTDDRERSAVLGWGIPEALPRPDVIDAFARQAAAHPDTPVLVDGELRLSYRELAERVAATAARLTGDGIRTGDVVGIDLPRGADQLVLVLATLQAGATVAPASGPAPTGPTSAGPAPAQAGRLVACRTRTAGTTGAARTVEVTRAALAAAVAGYARALGPRPGDRIAWLAEPGSPEAVETIGLAVSTGATLHPVPAPTAAGLAEAARLGAVTMALLPGVLARQVDAETLTRLRSAVAIGEGRPGAAHAGLVTAYGTAETGPVAWTMAGPDETGAVQLGRPAPGSRVYVLDDRLEPQPVGVHGEVYLGGPGLARGYHDSPRATAGAFRPDPFAGEPGARMVRTGDRARWRADGTLEYGGRIGRPWSDAAGRPLPCLRIAAVVGTHPAVADAVVVNLRRRHADPVLTAYVVAHADCVAPDLRELQRFLAAALPDYLIPGAVVAVPRLPSGPTGRLDLAALAPPDAEVAGRRPALPRNATERVLAGAWARVLGASDVGADDSFFDLGGHSLLAVQLLAYVGELFGLELELSLLFQAVTPAALAAELAGRLGGADRLETTATAVEAVLTMSEEELAARLAETDAAPEEIP
ncbi:condensation domain-containing protein [Paractinoplanes rishiriensis]|uniref:Carrier domain-containing protein n=1 Tax=Paractinoplanes rishiriensis TaxID=1050105 RepID=A0A919K286_9ACTN|nr:condensation domain-containing protein [Actinoplanes rishiriensis]GIE99526.1 hypothetical protein Ari01nite_69910 [Actinoplanes rishiriensis]